MQTLVLANRVLHDKGLPQHSLPISWEVWDVRSLRNPSLGHRWNTPASTRYKCNGLLWVCIFLLHKYCWNTPASTRFKCDGSLWVFALAVSIYTSPRTDSNIVLWSCSRQCSIWSGAELIGDEKTWFKHMLLTTRGTELWLLQCALVSFR